MLLMGGAGSGRQGLQILLLRPLVQGCRFCVTCSVFGAVQPRYWVGGLGQVVRGCPHACSCNASSLGALVAFGPSGAELFKSTWGLSSLESSCTLRELLSHTRLGSVPHLSWLIFVAPCNGDNYDAAISALAKGIQFPVVIVQSVRPMLWIWSNLLLLLFQPYFFDSLSKLLSSENLKKKITQGNRFSAQVLYT